MKYAYATMIVLCLLASTSWSASNPMIRNCHQVGGEFSVVVIDEGKFVDEVALCKIGSTYAGAFDVMLFNNVEAQPLAFTEYSSGITMCKGEIKVVNFVGSTETVKICQYADLSIIDISTLESGSSDEQNFLFNNYLGL